MNLRIILTLAIAACFAAIAPAAEPHAAQTQTELSTASLSAAIDALAAGTTANENDKQQAFVSWGEYVTASGHYFVPVMLYVPGPVGLEAGRNLTFFGIVRDESGRNVLAFEEPVTLAASKNDVYAERSLTLPGGRHRGYFGLAENRKPLVIASADMDLAGSLDKNAAAISRLILSDNLHPLPEAHAPDAPFSFGGIKVVPKGDRTFRRADELWYFFELRNPGRAEAAAASDSMVVPVISGTAKPRVQVKIDVVGTDTAGKNVKMVAPPREVDAIPVRGVPGHFAVGSAIPLETFQPGDYTFTVKVIDTVNKKSYTLSDTFRIVE